jgi:hypothetical protein
VPGFPAALAVGVRVGRETRVAIGVGSGVTAVAVGTICS